MKIPEQLLENFDYPLQQGVAIMAASKYIPRIVASLRLHLK